MTVSRISTLALNVSPILFILFSVSPTNHDGTGSDHDPGDFKRANLQGDNAPSSEEDQPERQGDQHDLHRHRYCDLIRRFQLAKVGVPRTLHLPVCFQMARNLLDAVWQAFLLYYCFHVCVQGVLSASRPWLG